MVIGYIIYEVRYYQNRVLDALCLQSQLSRASGKSTVWTEARKWFSEQFGLHLKNQTKNKQTKKKHMKQQAYEALFVSGSPCVACLSFSFHLFQALGPTTLFLEQIYCLGGSSTNEQKQYKHIVRVCYT